MLFALRDIYRFLVPGDVVRMDQFLGDGVEYWLTKVGPDDVRGRPFNRPVSSPLTMEQAVFSLVSPALLVVCQGKFLPAGAVVCRSTEDRTLLEDWPGGPIEGARLALYRNGKLVVMGASPMSPTMSIPDAVAAIDRAVNEQKSVPLVRLGDVATWLRPGDRFRLPGLGESVVVRTHGEDVVARDEGGNLAQWSDSCAELISPRLEPVPVGGVVKAGTPYAYLDGSEWTDFEPPVKDFANPSADCYQLIRDEPEQLPREVVAGPETLRAGDVVEFVNDGHGYLNPRWNEGAPHRLVWRDGSGWVIADWELGAKSTYRVPDGWIVQLLSRANQDPPAAEAQPEAGPQLEPDFTRVIRVDGTGEVEFINVASTNRYEIKHVEPVTGPAVPEKPQAAVEVCPECRQPFSAWRKPIEVGIRNLCGDCWAGPKEPASLDARIATARRELAESAPDPHAHLTPAQRYHLDDEDLGIPRHN